MSKGSGGTRATNSGTAHSGKSKSNPNGKYLKQKFTKAGEGDYQLDTPIGGGQILQSVDSVNQYKYGSKTIYEAQPWDSNYNMGQKKYFTTKGAAEEYIRSKMK